MTVLSLRRRFALVVVALLLAAALFRGHVATALVTRGDDAVRNGDRTAAIRYYERALRFDAGAVRAADRLAFTFAMRREPGDAQAAIAVATAGLARAGDDAALLADRALAEQHLHRWHAAEADFARAGTVAHDARYDHLAGRIALRLGDTAGARAFFVRAVIHDPTFMPARVALADVHR